MKFPPKYIAVSHCDVKWEVSSCVHASSDMSVFNLFSLQVILTADTPVVDHPGGIIFTSTDAGATFHLIQLPFHLAQPITYHFFNPDYLVALSIDVIVSESLLPAHVLVFLTVVSLAWFVDSQSTCEVHISRTHPKEKANSVLFSDLQGGLWLSLDFGAKWTKVHDGVFSFQW